MKTQFSCGTLFVALFTLVFGVFAGVGQSTAPVTAPASSAWTLEWSDEFEGEAGSGVDTANWLYDLGRGYDCNGCANYWGTGEIETMTDSTDNVYLDGEGHLAIKPIRTDNKWTSGRIETVRTDFQPPPGGIMAVEASIHLPDVTGKAAQGYWAAFWMLGDAFRGNYLNWPSVGEIDIMENINGLNTAYATLHCGIAPYGPCNETNGLGGNRPNPSPSLQSAFHTYRVELDTSLSPQELRFYLDGENFFTVKSTDVDEETWVNATDHSFFLILNVAIGGGWPGFPTKDTESGIPMLVDYVKVYYQDAPTS